MLQAMLEASDLLATLCITLAFVGLPALLALYWNSRPHENGLDWGSRQRLLAVGIAAVFPGLHGTTSGPSHSSYNCLLSVY